MKEVVVVVCETESIKNQVDKGDEHLTIISIYSQNPYYSEHQYTIMDSNSIIILIGGGHASGKKTAAMSLRDELQATYSDKLLNIDLINMADYAHSSNDLNQIKYSSSKSTAITVQDINDMKFAPLKPSRFDFDKLKSDIKQTIQQDSRQILIVHGLYALYDSQLRDMANLKVFINSDADTRLIRWIRRDVSAGKQPLETVMNQYLQGARAEMNDFILPTKGYSDVILPLGPEPNAIKLLVDGIVPHISKQEQHIPHLRSTDLTYNDDKTSYYELN